MNKNNKTRRKISLLDIFVFALIVIIVGTVIWLFVDDHSTNVTINRNELLGYIANGDVKEIYFEGAEGGANANVLYVYGYFKDAFRDKSDYDTFTYCGDRADRDLIEAAIITEAPDVVILGNNPVSSFDWFGMITVIVSIASVAFLIFFLTKGIGGSNNKAFEFSKNRAQMVKNVQIKFRDVAGLDEEKEEMMELVDFLKNPAKYYQMGARIPKGVLLVGDPGTGKTLIAKAVAGEAEVPFFSISGSDFVEMFVGVGASRVRDMFKTAKSHAPCIIFIDEIDAVGRQRGAGLGGGHDEREQTLNQMLVEMDGFSTNSGVIVLAATNRADILDPALLRPGRFDRQLTISLPDVKAREQILLVHARNKKFSKRVNFLDIARRTPTFSGADLENLLNEAALLAARENASEIKIYHIDEAVDRVMMGPAKKSRKYNEMEKATTAYHEAGHAVIGIKLKDANVVQKVTIIPRGKTGGYNLITPKDEYYFATKEMLRSNITMFLAGRIAEELVFNEMSTGCYNDFQNATEIARSMVTEYGMSKLGPIQYENNRGKVFLGRDYMNEKNFSDQVALEIDIEVRSIIDDCYKEGTQILTENRHLLDLIAKNLIEVETLTKEDIEELVNTGQLAWWEKKKAKIQAGLVDDTINPNKID